MGMDDPYGFVVEIEHGGAEVLFPLSQDLLGGGTGVRRRRVVERGQFGNMDAIVGLLPLSHLRETTALRGWSEIR